MRRFVWPLLFLLMLTLSMVASIITDAIAAQGVYAPYGVGYGLNGDQQLPGGVRNREELRAKNRRYGGERRIAKDLLSCYTHVPEFRTFVDQSCQKNGITPSQWIATVARGINAAIENLSLPVDYLGHGQKILQVGAFHGPSFWRSWRIARSRSEGAYWAITVRVGNDIFDGGILLACGNLLIFQPPPPVVPPPVIPPPTPPQPTPTPPPPGKMGLVFAEAGPGGTQGQWQLTPSMPVATVVPEIKQQQTQNQQANPKFDQVLQMLQGGTRRGPITMTIGGQRIDLSVANSVSSSAASATVGGGSAASAGQSSSAGGASGVIETGATTITFPGDP